MKSWRIIKDSPKTSAAGSCTNETWTAISDIGKIYQGKQFDLEEYLSVERKYILVILMAMQELHQSHLKIVLLEKNDYNLIQQYSDIDGMTKNEFKKLKDNIGITFCDIPKIVQSSLREIIWCRLQGEESFTIHFGYDFYVYLESKYELPQTMKLASDLGLYMEPFDAPFSLKNEQIDIEDSIMNLEKFNVTYELPKDIFNQRIMLMKIEYVCETLEQKNNQWNSHVQNQAQKKVNKIVKAYKTGDIERLLPIKEKIKRWKQNKLW